MVSADSLSSCWGPGLPGVCVLEVSLQFLRPPPVGVSVPAGQLAAGLGSGLQPTAGNERSCLRLRAKLVFFGLAFFPLFLHLLTPVIKFLLWRSGQAEEAKGFLQTRGGDTEGPVPRKPPGLALSLEL